MSDWINKLLYQVGDSLNFTASAVPVNAPRGASNLKWVPALNGDVPANAVADGKSGNGEVLYVGRAMHGNCFENGKVYPSRKCLIICENGTESKYSEYEVLVKG